MFQPQISVQAEDVHCLSIEGLVYSYIAIDLFAQWWDLTKRAVL